MPSLTVITPARRNLTTEPACVSEVLLEDVAAAAVDFITGPLLEAPYRIGKPLRDKLAGFHSARLGTQWRVLYRIDESKRVVVVHDAAVPGYWLRNLQVVPDDRSLEQAIPLIPNGRGVSFAFPSELSSR